MTDGVKVLATGIGGAVVGSVAGYLLFTRHGETVRRDMVPQLEEFLQRFQELQRSVAEARHVASESWQTLQDLTGGSGVSGRTP